MQRYNKFTDLSAPCPSCILSLSLPQWVVKIGIIGRELRPIRIETCVPSLKGNNQGRTITFPQLKINFQALIISLLPIKGNFSSGNRKVHLHFMDRKYL